MLTARHDRVEMRLSPCVYLAYHAELDVRTVLRLGPGELKQREAAVLRHLQKQGWSGAPKYLGEWSGEGRTCLRVEYVSGRSAHERYLGKGLQPECLIGFARLLARLLRSLHELGVAHLDVKPENVVCKADGGLVLIDWEHARFLDGDDEPVLLYGTEGYMAPELRRGRAPTRVHAGMDVWSYAATLCRLATGRDDLAAPLEHGVFNALPGWFSAMLRRAMTVDAGRRPTMDQLCRDYFSLAAGEWSEASIAAIRQYILGGAPAAEPAQRQARSEARPRVRQSATHSPPLQLAAPIARRPLASPTEPCLGARVRLNTALHSASHGAMWLTG